MGNNVNLMHGHLIESKKEMNTIVVILKGIGQMHSEDSVLHTRIQTSDVTKLAHKEAC